MSDKEYEYHGLLAESWDLFRGDTSNWPDRFFYRDVIEQYGQPVLDVGCATGRLLLDYMADGVDIDGVDISPEMLAICREKTGALGLQPALYQQAMEEIDLPRKYRTILVSSSSFQLLLEPAQAKQAMQRFFNHLEPGGALVMPFMVLWQPGDPVATEWKQTGEQSRPEDGAIFRRWSRADYDVENQLEHTEDRYEVSRDGEIVVSEHHRRSPATRWYSQKQAKQLYREAGFTEIRLLKGFTHEPATPDDTLFSVIGIRL